MEGILDSLPEKVFAIDTEKRITYANVSLLDSCGIKPEDIVGKTCSDIPGCCPIADECGECPHEDVLDIGHPVRKRFNNFTPDGLKRTIELNSSPLRGPDGKITGAVAVIRDVSEAVKIEEILARYAEGLTVLHELSTVFLTTTGLKEGLEPALTNFSDYYGADFTLVLVPGTEDNTLEAIKGTGWAEGDIDGLTMTIDRQYMAGYSMLERCPAIVSDFGRDERFKQSPLMERYGVMSGLSVPMVADDRSVGVLCIFYKKPMDIDTAELWYLNVAANALGVYLQKERSLEKLQKSEAFVSSILEALGEGVVVVNRNFRIVSANKEYLKMVGMDAEEVVGRSCFKVSHQTDAPCYEHGEFCTVKQVFETGSRSSSLHTHYNKDGLPVYVQTHAYPVLDAAGFVTAAVETIMDVTDKVTLERDLEKRVKELEEFYDMAVGRELKMIELKEEIEQLKAELRKQQSPS